MESLWLPIANGPMARPSGPRPSHTLGRRLENASRSPHHPLGDLPGQHQRRFVKEVEAQLKEGFRVPGEKSPRPYTRPKEEGGGNAQRCREASA